MLRRTHRAGVQAGPRAHRPPDRLAPPGGLRRPGKRSPLRDRVQGAAPAPRPGVEATIAQGLDQTSGYTGRCGGTSGHLVLFDLDGEKSWDEKVFRREAMVANRTITVWGM